MALDLHLTPYRLPSWVTLPLSVVGRDIQLALDVLAIAIEGYVAVVDVLDSLPLFVAIGLFSGLRLSPFPRRFCCIGVLLLKSEEAVIVKGIASAFFNSQRGVSAMRRNRRWGMTLDLCLTPY